MRTKATIIRTTRYDMSTGNYVTYGIIDNNNTPEERVLIKDNNHNIIASHPLSTIVKTTIEDKLIRIHEVLDVWIDIVLIKDDTLYFYYNDELYSHHMSKDVIKRICNAVFGISYATPLLAKLFINLPNTKENDNTNEETRSESTDN